MPFTADSMNAFSCWPRTFHGGVVHVVNDTSSARTPWRSGLRCAASDHLRSGFRCLFSNSDNTELAQMLRRKASAHFAVPSSGRESAPR